MPLNIYTSPDEKETVEVIQKMNDVHEFYKDGVKWRRIFQIPQASIDTKIDPFDQRKFIEKTGQSGGSLGSIMDRSKEASLAREKVIGFDPIAKARDEKWQNTRVKKDGTKRRIIGDANSRKFNISAD